MKISRGHHRLLEVKISSKDCEYVFEKALYQVIGTHNYLSFKSCYNREKLLLLKDAQRWPGEALHMGNKTDPKEFL